MKFITNKILNPTGNETKFDDWVAKSFGKQASSEETKTASEAAPECDGDPRGQCRGQVINNDNEEGANSYQKGESVDGKEDQKEGKKSKEADSQTQTKEAECGKEMGECDKAGDVTEEHSDAANADVGKAQVEQNINNDPNYQKGESTDPGKIDGKKKKQPDDPVVGKSSATKNKYRKVASLKRQEKIQLFAALAANKTNPLNYVEAMVGIKLANMTEDEKNYLRRFWLTMYPRDYVENMIEDR